MSLRRTHNRKPAPTAAATAAATGRLAAVLRAGLRVGAPDPAEPRNRLVFLRWTHDTGEVETENLMSVMYREGLQGSDTSHAAASGGVELNWTLRPSATSGGFARVLRFMFDFPHVRAFGTRQTDEVNAPLATAIRNDEAWTRKNTLTFEHPPGEWHVLGRVVPQRRKGGPATKIWACPHAVDTPEYAALFAKLYEYVLAHADDPIGGPIIWLKNVRDGSVPS